MLYIYRDLVDKVVEYMTKGGTNIIVGVTPTNIEKINSKYLCI